MNKPKGKCLIVGATQRQGRNSVAVYARVIVVDTEGTQFYFDASCFTFDLTPMETIDTVKTHIG